MGVQLKQTANSMEKGLRVGSWLSWETLVVQPSGIFVGCGGRFLCSFLGGRGRGLRTGTLSLGGPWLRGGERWATPPIFGFIGKVVGIP